MRSPILALPCVCLAAVAVVALSTSAQAATATGPAGSLDPVPTTPAPWWPPQTPAPDLGPGPVPNTDGTTVTDPTTPAPVCGQPEVPDSYTSIEHPAVVTRVPAITHTAWLWTRTVATVEVETTREVPAEGTWRWTRTTSLTEDAYRATALDDDGQPVPSGPVVWVARGTTPPADLVATGESRTSQDVETDDLPAGSTPAGEGWVRGDFTETVPAHTDTRWIVEGDAVPDGYAPTGEQRPGEPRSEITDQVMAAAPAGEGWTALADSAVEVVDEPAYDRIDVPAWIEDFILVPGTPATAPCPSDDPTSVGGVDDLTGEIGEIGTALEHAADTDDDAAPGSATPALDRSGGAAASPVGEDEAASTPVSAPTAGAPDDGSDLDPWLLLFGVGGAVVIAGAVGRSSTGSD